MSRKRTRGRFPERVRQRRIDAYRRMVEKLNSGAYNKYEKPNKTNPKRERVEKEIKRLEEILGGYLNLGSTERSTSNS